MGRTDIASMVIDAPCPRVFAALLDPDDLVCWLPPEGMTGRFEYFDARPGGSYRMVLTYDEPLPAGGKTDAHSDVVEGRFLEIVDQDRIVQATGFDTDDVSLSGTMRMSWSLTAVPGGTRVEFRADNVPEGISAQDHQDGMNSSLTNLARYLSDRNG
ncbi:SRPBCC family protein [Mycolicibacterium vaccae]|uniref:SRPBCC family protein n=1 Tax=Mycolicibacterium vaccae TaxID=1810 RepID=UPI003CFBBBE0